MFLLYLLTQELWEWLKSCPVMQSKGEKVNLGKYNQAVNEIGEEQNTEQNMQTHKPTPTNK